MKKSLKTALGGLDQRVLLQTPIYETDGSGGQVITWQNVCFLWVGIKPINERLELRGAGQATRNRFEVCFHNRQDIQVGQQLLWGDKTLVIQTIAQAGRRDLLITITCQELVA